MNMIRTLTTDEIDSVAGAGYSLPSTLTSLSVTVGGPVATVSQIATAGAGGYATATTGASSWNVLSGNAIGGNGGNATNVSKIVQIEKIHIL